MTSPGCGFDRQVKGSNVHYIDGKLVEYGHGDMQQVFTVTEKQNWYRSFLWQAQHTGRKIGWATSATIEFVS
jgi:hypothetical protein